jgi:hypothetical protein
VRLLPKLHVGHLLPADKVGIRAQMLDHQTGRLVMDFLVEQSPASPTSSTSSPQLFQVFV